MSFRFRNFSLDYGHDLHGLGPTTDKLDFKLCISTETLHDTKAAPMTDLVTQHIAGEESYSAKNRKLAKAVFRRAFDVLSSLLARC